MQINFRLPLDSQYHQYCPSCNEEDIHRIYQGDKTYYRCKSCRTISPRMIVFDPKILWWIDGQSKEYWHESVGIFISNDKKEILLFQRVIYPFALAIPAGHLGHSELPDQAIRREVFEETSLDLAHIRLFSGEDVVGDQCRRGADSHRWHLYTAKVSGQVSVIINDEGTEPVWLSLDEALAKELVFPVRYFIEKYHAELVS